MSFISSTTHNKEVRHFFKMFLEQHLLPKSKNKNSLTTSESKLSSSKYVYTCLQYIDNMSNPEQFQKAWAV